MTYTNLGFDDSDFQTMQEDCEKKHQELLEKEVSRFLLEQGVEDEYL